MKTPKYILKKKREYYIINRDKILKRCHKRWQEKKNEINKKRREKYRILHPPRIPSFDKKSYQAEYYKKNRERLLALQKQYLQKPEIRKRISAYRKKRYLDKHDIIRKRYAEWYQKNKQKRSIYNKKWRQENPERCRENMRRFWERNPAQVKIRGIGMEIRRCIKNDTKATRYWEKLVGYTLEDLMAHLESMFDDGMTWNNHGEWHIDHIKPVNEFTEKQVAECWSLDNLQPLWADDNMRKGR